MFKNRFLLVLAVLSLLLVSLAVANPISNDPEAVDTSWPPRPDYSRLNEKPLVSIPNTDFYQRHPSWKWVSRVMVIPISGISELTDYFQRHPELSAPRSVEVDTTDYFMRHPELTISVDTSADLTDYFFRHP